MAKVYVSSTYLDLQDCREQVMRVLRAMGHEDMAMEYYVAEDQRPVDKCLADVAACDLYVGIFAWRYGWVPKQNNPDQLSITELEYRQAVKTGKPCLIFFLEGRAPWPPDFIDDDKTQIKKLRAELNEKHVIAYFKSAENIDSVVATAIHNWDKQHSQISPSTLIPQFDLSAYFNALKKRYQRLDLDALTPPQKEEYLQLQLRSVFVEQNVRENPPPVELPKEMWERLQHEQEIHPEDLPAGMTLDDVRRTREIYYEKPLRPVLEILADTRHQDVIILGDPGAGKSTLARYVLLSLIDPTGDEKLRRDYDGYLPLLIELRSYAGLCAENKCDTFLEFLEYLGKTEGWHLTKDALHHYLKTDGRAVVIFDGLDEIFNPEERERIARQIVGFASDYPKARIIVTSRVIGYRRKILEDAGFAHFTLQDLDEKQVTTFVERWYALALSDRPDEAKERRERIMRSFKESASIRQLAGNPMLLTIMAIIGKHQELPHERWKLYDHAASVLIQHWDVNKHLKDQRVEADFIGEDDKKELLRRLAYKMQGGAGGLAGNYIHREHLQAEFEAYLKERYGQTPDRAVKIARAMIDQFRERNFILSLYGANVYGFVHRAFLEYFCAAAFVHKFEKTQELTLEQLKQEVYGKHWEDQSWHEVLRLICGVIDEKWAGEIIDYLATEVYHHWPREFGNRPPWNIMLAITCIGEVRNFGLIEPISQKVIERAFELIEHGIFSDLRLQDFINDRILPAILSIGGLFANCPNLAKWMPRIRKFKFEWWSWNSLSNLGIIIGTLGAGLDSIRSALLDFLDEEKKWPPLYLIGLWGIAQGWRNYPLTLSLLRDRAVNDARERVREAAISALTEHFRDDPQTLPLLHDRAINDEHEKVRIAAVTALVKHFRDDPQTLPLLYDRAVKDEYNPLKTESGSKSVRLEAVRVLIEHFRDDPKIVPLLQDRAVNDTHEKVCGAAVSALAELLRNDPETLPQLRDWAANSPYSGVRSAALTALAQHSHDDPQTLPLLRDRVVNDAHESVRSTAVSALARHFRNNPQTLPLVRDRAVNDNYTPSSNDLGLKSVRQVALKAIIDYWRNDSKTLPLLRDRAVKDVYEGARSAALSALIEHFRADPQTLSLVRDRALCNDYSPAPYYNWTDSVRYVALKGIIDYWRDDPQTLPLLHDRVVNDSYERIRFTTASALAAHFHDDPQTLPLLIDRIVHEANDLVRLSNLNTLVRYFHDDPRIFSLVCNCAVNDTQPWLRSAAFDLLTRHFGDAPQTLPLLNNWAVNAPHGNVRSLAIDALAEHFRDDPPTLPRLRDWAVNASHSEVRAAAVTALARYFREDSQTLSLLRDWVISSPCNKVRSDAVYALARYFRADPQTLPLVRDRVVNDTHEQVRAAAVSTLARHFRADPQTLALVRDRAINDAHEKVRSTAVSAHAEHFRGDTLTLPLVHDRAIKDAHEEVRFAAVSAMAKNFRNDPQTLPRLRAWAANASHSEVRSAAISAIVGEFRFHPQNLSLIRDRVSHDPSEEVRSVAVTTMVEHFRSDPQTSPLVYYLAVNDRHEKVRLAAVSALVRYFCTDPQTVPLLCNRAINDESPKPDDKKKTDEYYVRETAINALARYWPTHPDTLPLLRERAENDPTPWLRERAKELVEQLSKEKI